MSGPVGKDDGALGVGVGILEASLDPTCEDGELELAVGVFETVGACVG